MPEDKTESSSVSTARSSAAPCEAEAELLRTILNGVDAGIYVADMQTYELLFVNDFFKQIFGDIVGKTCWQVLQRDQTGPCAFCTNPQLVDERGEPTGLVVWQHHNLLVDRWYSVHDRAIRWRDGRVVRLEIAADITGRHAAEELLRQNEERLRDIMRTVGEGVFVLDTHGRATFANPKATELLGWTEQEMLGRDLHDLVHKRRPDGDEMPASACPVCRVLEAGETVNVHEDYYLRKDGTFLPVAYVAAPLVREGRIVGTVSAFHDITTRKVAEAEQSRLIEELQTALTNVKTLTGLLPVCAWCKKIRNDDGYWQQVDVYLREHADVQITHGMCTECSSKMLSKLEQGGASQP